MVLFTATCPKGHQDASWSQRPGNGLALPEHFDIICGACIVMSSRRPLPTTSPEPQAVPPQAQPLVLRGYRYLRAAVTG